jgi:hypothetical protein
MKTLGISIDGVIRDIYEQFDKHYRKVYINNPNHVEMNQDMTVKERTEEDWKKLEEIIAHREKELISLPINSYDLTNHYTFKEAISLDGETTLTPEEALEDFMFNKYPFQIFGQAEEYEGACDAINRIQAYGLRNNLYKTVLISKTKSSAIPATFHFLAKNASRIRNVQFVDEDSDKWDHCDVIIDCVPEVIQNVPDGKQIIKIEHAFNKWDDTEHSFKTIREINPNFIEELFVGEKK